MEAYRVFEQALAVYAVSLALVSRNDYPIGLGRCWSNEVLDSLRMRQLKLSLTASHYGLAGLVSQDSLMRFLFVTAFPPFPIDRSGGAIRSKLIIDALSAIGEVSLFYLNYRGEDHFIEDEINRFDHAMNWNVERSINFFNKGIRKRLNKVLRALRMFYRDDLAAAGIEVSGTAARALQDLAESRRFDLVVGRLSRATAVSGLLDIDELPLLVDADDWEPSRIRSQLAMTPHWDLPARAMLGRMKLGSDRLASRLLTRADHIFLASDKDTQSLASNITTTLPNLPLTREGGSIPPLPRSPAGSKTVFGVGEWTARQNSDGMTWFLRYCWPIIVGRLPEAKLRIAGRSHAALSRNWGRSHNVEVLGFVDDLAREYDQAAVIATPITWGGGTKIKVLEALAHGRVPLGTTHAFDGALSEAELAQIDLTSDDPAELADRFVVAITDPEARWAKEVQCLEYFQSNYKLDDFNDTIQRKVLEIVEATRRGKKPDHKEVQTLNSLGSQPAHKEGIT
ncbi:glycosyltransferase [Rhizobium rhizophilum]|uniref:Glycosyltransferase n=1 Tax=Rhizobium rhizophilum TaxID=1850373 RepID=A0ABY2QW31_9HYPH|nr:glycosyltransferase family 4 protein [Rhizobium rhizophilum]THV15288.1 glycosyltransferase [Rhizobium rhizophilum]